MMMNILKLIGREYPLFRDDISKKNDELADLVSSNKFLVIKMLIIFFTPLLILRKISWFHN